MLPVIILLALTLFMWTVAVWATIEDDRKEPEQKDAEQPMEQPDHIRKAA